ncbi:MAG: hypothetical protein ACREBE_23755 [bacterium]
MIAIVIALMAPTSAVGGRVAIVDLDKDDEAAHRLAEAAGACQPSLPAFIRTWCNTEHPPKPLFTRRYEATARAAGKGIVSIIVPVTEYGKGFVSALAQPKVRCNANVCLPARTVAVRIRTTAAATDVRVVTASFYVAGMWRDHQWWGPKLANVTVELFDATGKQIGDGTIAP